MNRQTLPADGISCPRIKYYILNGFIVSGRKIFVTVAEGLEREKPHRRIIESSESCGIREIKTTQMRHRIIKGLWQELVCIIRELKMTL